MKGLSTAGGRGKARRSCRCGSSRRARWARQRHRLARLRPRVRRLVRRAALARRARHDRRPRRSHRPMRVRPVARAPLGRHQARRRAARPLQGPGPGWGRTPESECGDGADRKAQPNRLLVRAASNAGLRADPVGHLFPSRVWRLRNAVEEVVGVAPAGGHGIELLAVARKMPAVKLALEGFTDAEVWSEMERRADGCAAGRKAFARPSSRRSPPHPSRLATIGPTVVFFARWSPCHAAMRPCARDWPARQGAPAARGHRGHRCRGRGVFEQVSVPTAVLIFGASGAVGTIAPFIRRSARRSCDGAAGPSST